MLERAILASPPQVTRRPARRRSAPPTPSKPKVEAKPTPPGESWDLSLQSPALFALEHLSGPPEAPYHGRFRLGRHHHEWDQLVLAARRLCVLAPRDHGKTFFFDFAVPLWKAATIPGGIGYIFSATREQAIRILEDIKLEIETNPKLRWLVPARKTRWSGGTIRLSNGHVIHARGYQSRIRGAHPHWIICDDVLNDETAYSEVTRRKQIEYFYSAVTNMVRPGGQIIVVGTPFHQSDLYADLRKNKAYTFRRYCAMDSTGRALWPLRYNKSRLVARRDEIGAIRFAREFQCDPVSDDLSLFPGGLFVGDPTEQFTICLGAPLKLWQTLEVSIYMGVDIALSATAGADFFVAWAMGVDRRGNRWVVDIVRAKGLSFQGQLSAIARMARRYEVGLIFIEANQMQQVWGNELIRLTDLPVKQFVTTGRGKHSLDKGVPGLRVLLENGKFRIPRGDRRSVELTDVWIEEMRAVTWDGQVRSLGEHDDTVMAAWICDQAIRRGGFSFSFGDDEDDADGEGIEIDAAGNLVDDTEAADGGLSGFSIVGEGDDADELDGSPIDDGV